MKREELNERKRLLELQADHTRWFSQEEFDRLRELSNKMFAEHPLPPAEGAVPDNAAEQNKWMREWFKERTGLDDTLLSIHMKQIDVMLKGVQPQPTAEGAEEKSLIGKPSIPFGFRQRIYTEETVKVMIQEHTALHAQRLAEKMVEEELMKFLQWDGISDELARKITVTKYLKNRDK